MPQSVIINALALNRIPSACPFAHGKNRDKNNAVFHAVNKMGLERPGHGVQAYYARMLCNTGLAQKAITAVARKLAIILWRLTCEMRAYRPA